MVDPSPLNLTISHQHQLLRRVLQIHLPSCSTCSYAYKGKIMFLATTLVRKWPSQIHFHLSSPNLPLRLHWILPSTMPACPLSKRKPSNWLLRRMLRCMLWLISSSLAGLMTSRKFNAHCIPTGNTMNHSLLKMDLCSVEKPSSSLHQKGRRSLVLCTNHIKGITKTQLLPCGCVFWPGINKAIEEAVWQCETYMSFQAQNAATPLTPIPSPSCPWQICVSDIFILDGMDYLSLADFYSKVILVSNLPTGQSQLSQSHPHAWKNGFVIMVHQKSYTQIMVSQYASAAFADCSIEWGFTHETSSPHHPQSNGFAESCVKIIKHTFQHAKYSGTNPGIALQYLKTIPG